MNAYIMPTWVNCFFTSWIPDTVASCPECIYAFEKAFAAIPAKAGIYISLNGFLLSQEWYFAGMVFRMYGGFAPATCRELPECTIIPTVE